MTSSTVAVEVGGSSMSVYVATPPGDGPHPAVIAIMHAAGVDEFMKDICDRLAAAGYIGAAPDLYHRNAHKKEFQEPLPPRGHPDFREKMLARSQSVRDPEIVDDVNALVDYLASHPNVKRDAIGLTGFCSGGRVAYLMAAKNQTFQAVAPFYGANIMNERGDAPAPFTFTKDINCPMLFLFGNDDTNPSPADREKLDAELTRLGKPHTFIGYDGASHAFMNFAGNTYNEEAAKDAWPRLIDFLNEHLKREVATGAS